MKFYCGPSKEEKRAKNTQKEYDKAREFYLRYRDWSKCFAWWPVRLIDGRCAWLETVEVKFKFPYSEKDVYNNLYIESWSMYHVDIEFKYRDVNDFKNNYQPKKWTK